MTRLLQLCLPLLVGHFYDHWLDMGWAILSFRSGSRSTYFKLRTSRLDSIPAHCYPTTQGWTLKTNVELVTAGLSGLRRPAKMDYENKLVLAPMVRVVSFPTIASLPIGWLSRERSERRRSSFCPSFWMESVLI